MTFLRGGGGSPDVSRGQNRYVTLPLCLPENCAYLTVFSNKNIFFFAIDDVHWCALTLGEQKRQLKEINHNGDWSDKVSILVYSLTYDKVSVWFCPWCTMKTICGYVKIAIL